MIKISNIKISAEISSDRLTSYAASALGLRENDLTLVKILKLSVDSRKKPNVNKVFTAVFKCENERKLVKRYPKTVSFYTEKKYKFPYSGPAAQNRPVVVGFGPGGIMASLMLTRAGIPPIVIERGYDIDTRTSDVASFWSGGELKENSNVQFGEGGAGLFSDGKLTTGINDERIGYVLSEFVSFGAPEDILYLSKPHIGTDRLKITVKNIRQYLISKGCDIRFGAALTGINTSGGKIVSATVSDSSGTYDIKTDALILALGNSARDTFKMLRGSGLDMEKKPFAVGVRIEHLQKEIDLAQYGDAATLGTLPASDYKLAVHLKGGRSVFTFCVCPGGYVVAAASEKGGVVTNGMSEYMRDNININGGLLVSVTPEDFEGLFGGIEFQESLEKSAFISGGKNYFAPAQKIGDFLNKTPTVSFGKVKPSYTPGVMPCNLWDVLPDFICQAIADAIPQMEKKIHGFSDPEGVLTAVETRSSCPIRIIRGQDGMASISGIFPCGEGAGYAGGITSASVDGIKAAEQVCKYLGTLTNFISKD